MAKSVEKDSSTEEKIKKAASEVFTQKGFAATRTRDIAEAAGINLALLNYYFRSKVKLFQLVMEGNLFKFFHTILQFLNDDKTDLEGKIEQFVESYTELLLKNEDLPLFVFNELKNRPNLFTQKLKVKSRLMKSSFYQQLKEQNPGKDPFQFLVSLLGMTIFPFVAKNVLFPEEEEFITFVRQRKAIVVQNAKLMLEN